jgi:hypothetical protein
MKNTISQKQKTIIWVSIALVLAASALSSVLENQHKTSLGFGNQPSSSNWQMQNDSGNNLDDNTDDMNSDSSGADAIQPNQDNMPSISSGGFGADQGVVTGSDSSSSPDLGSSAVTDGYAERQAIQDGIARDQSNNILDQTTVRNEQTGETFQTESGSDSYYQSPSVDAAAGGSGIVGVDAGATAPSDGTQLSVVTGSDSGSSSSSSTSTGGE